MTDVFKNVIVLLRRVIRPGFGKTREKHLKTIGKYEVIEELGSGGMGTVYQARHPGLGKIVAVKVLSSE